MSSRPFEGSESRCLGRLRRSTDKTSLKIAARAATFSEFALLLTWVDRPSGDTSDGDETGVDVNTVCAEEEEFSGHDFAQRGGFVIFPHFLHRFLSLFDFLPFVALAARLGIRTFV